jgi:polar amino acid transport system permease protein
MLDLKGYGHFLVEGTMVTMSVALVSMIGAILLGLLGAAAKLSSHGGLRRLGGAYTTIIRGVPDLVLLLLVFYGGTVLVQWIACWFGRVEPIDINAFITGSVVVSFVYGAYATEVFRGAFQSVPKGQIEAAKACGMSRWLCFRRIQLPQVWRFALPGLGNIFLVLLKDTSLVSVIGLEELMRKSAIAVSFTKQPFTFYLAAAAIYLLMTIVSMVGLNLLERRADRGVRRASP